MGFWVKAIVLIIAMFCVTPIVFLSIALLLGKFFKLDIAPDSVVAGMRKRLSR
jgi:hypothetical protein